MNMNGFNGKLANETTEMNNATTWNDNMRDDFSI